MKRALIGIVVLAVVVAVFWDRQRGDTRTSDNRAVRTSANPTRPTASRSRENGATHSRALERARAAGFPEEDVYLSSIEHKWRDTATEFGLSDEESDHAWAIIQTYRGRLYRYALDQLQRDRALETIDFMHVLATDAGLIAARDEAVKELAMVVPAEAHVGLFKTEPLLFPDELKNPPPVPQGPVPAEPESEPPPPPRTR